MPSRIVSVCKSGEYQGLAKALSVSTINSPDMWGRFPVYYAVRYNNIAALRYMLELGADPYVESTISGRRDNLVMTALRTGVVETVKVVISIWRSYTDISDLLPLCFSKDNSTELLASVIEGFNIRSLKGAESVLCRRAKIGDFEWLLHHNICFDLQQALRYCLIYGRPHCFMYLLRYIKHQCELDYVYTNAGSRGTHTLVSLCCLYGHYKGLLKLLKLGASADVITINNHGETMNNLCVAVANEHYRHLRDIYQTGVTLCIKYLISQGVSLNWQNSRGQTALMMAMRAHNGELTNLLLAAGADPTLRDMNGESAADYMMGGGEGMGEEDGEETSNVVN